MKKWLMLTIAVALCTSTALAQRSVVKTNVVSYFFPVTTGNLTYEYSVGPKFSIGTSAHIPLSAGHEISALAEQNDGETFDWTGQIEASGFAVTPFARFYPKAALDGFYVELFARYYNYDFVIPYDYSKDGSTINEDGVGDADGFGGGLVLGWQFGLGPNFVLDLFVGMGLASGNAHVETPDDSSLDADDFADIAQKIEDNKDIDVFLLDKTFEEIETVATATKASATVENQIFPMLRGGISFGYKF